MRFVIVQLTDTDDHEKAIDVAERITDLLQQDDIACIVWPVLPENEHFSLEDVK